MKGLGCTTCGFEVIVENGIIDFIALDKQCQILRPEIRVWDEMVPKYPTWELRHKIDSLQDYFRGKVYTSVGHRSRRPVGGQSSIVRDRLFPRGFSRFNSLSRKAT
jgi:hypothetical protein